MCASDDGYVSVYVHVYVSVVCCLLFVDVSVHVYVYVYVPVRGWRVVLFWYVCFVLCGGLCVGCLSCDAVCLCSVLFVLVCDVMCWLV